MINAHIWLHLDSTIDLWRNCRVAENPNFATQNKYKSSNFYRKKYLEYAIVLKNHAESEKYILQSWIVMMMEIDQDPETFFLADPWFSQKN